MQIKLSGTNKEPSEEESSFIKKSVWHDSGTDFFTMVQTFLLHDVCNLNELIKKMSFGDFWPSAISVLELGDHQS